MNREIGKFFVNGKWMEVEKKCSTCRHVKHFKPRSDERYSMGCGKYGWEGYTSDEDMACDGVFFFPKHD